MTPDTTNQRPSWRRSGGVYGFALAALLGCLVLPLSTAPALAASVTDRPLLFSFNGHDTTAGGFSSNGDIYKALNSVAVDDSSGDVYVVDGSHEAIDRFDSSGKAQSFSAGPAAGTSSLYGPKAGEPFKIQNNHFFNFFSDIAVDNSGGHGGAGEGEQGRLYVSGTEGPIDAFKPNGELLWTLPTTSVEGDCGVAVDAAGHLWVGTCYKHKLLEFGTTGASPPSNTPIKEFATSSSELPSRLGIDQSGANLYVAQQWNTGGDTDKYVNGIFDSTLTANPVRSLAVDQSKASGHIFTVEENSKLGDQFATLREYEPCATPGCAGTQVPGSPFGHELIGYGMGVAYSSYQPPAEAPLDWLYVSDLRTGTVRVFGPLTSGTVPDVSMEKTDGITRTEATVHATIDPQGVPNSYHVELIKGERQLITVEASGGSFTLGLSTVKGTGVTTSGSTQVTGVVTGFGAFHAGDAIAGEGMPRGEGAGDLKAGSEIVSNLNDKGTVFAVGETIAGAGIPAKTTIVAAGGGNLTLSAPATATGTKVGLRAFPTVVSVGSGTLTLSNSAIGTYTSASLLGSETSAPIAWNALANSGAGNIQSALTALPGIGAGNISVTGTPGEYDVTLEGTFAGRDLYVEGDGSNLTGATPKLTVKTLTGGAAGWASATSQPLEPYPSVNPAGGAQKVSVPLIGLERGTTYDVRVVATNTEAGKHLLSAYASPPATFTTLSSLPPTVSGLAISAVTADTAHVAFTVNPQESKTTWRILTSAAVKAGATRAECEALGESSFGTAKEATIPSGELAPVGVAADLTGLEHAQTYCVRVTATNDGGSAPPESESFTTAVERPSEAETAFVAPRSDTGARLNAYVNPEGQAPLTYRFEYSADGGASWTALPDRVSSVETRSKIVVGEQLEGLTPNTTYSYRFSAENSADEGSPAQGGERTFTTRTRAEVEEVNPPSCANEEVRAAQRSEYLPDCRGVELVNQPDKGNQNAVTEQLPQGISPFSEGGEDMLWHVNAGAPGSPTGTHGIFLSSRAPGGWGTQSVLPPAEQLEGGGQTPFSALTASADFSRFLLQPEAVLAGALVRCDRGQRCEAIARFGEKQGVEGGKVDTTGDLAHVVATDPGSNQLTDYGSGAPEALSIMPDGKESECGLEGEGKSFVGTGANPIAAAALWRPGYHMIATTDASRVYFEVKPNKPGGGCETSAPLGLYVRNRESKETTLIDPGVANAAVPDNFATYASPRFIRATPDGRSAYFVTDSKLDPADTNEHLDVYRWDEATKKSSCLTCVVPDANVDPLTFGTVAVSDDGSHVYFQSRSQLVPGRGTAGDYNIYVLSGGQVRFVANNGGLRDARITPDGNVVVFESGGGLTADAVAASAGTQLYRYDDRDQSIECVSCAHDATTTAGVGTSGSYINYTPFDLSSDGRTIAFTTTQKLVPADVNATFDVYEWHNGVVSLITDGVTRFNGGAATPGLVGIGGNGRDVFFAVAQPGLTGFEQDGLVNLYDARIGGGFMPPSPPEACAEDSCQGPLTPLPFTALPGSALVFGAGNVSAPVAKPKAKSLTHAQKLAAALKACRKKAKGKKRTACERQARKRYGPLKARKALRTVRGGR